MPQHEIDTASAEMESLLYGIRRTTLPDAILSSQKLKTNTDVFPSIDKLKIIRLSKIRYREKKDIKYAMTSLYSALHGINVPIVFILTGEQNQTNIYLGAWDESMFSTIKELKAAIKGFIPGSEFTEVSDGKSVIDSIKQFKFINSIVGIPSEKQLFQDEKRVGPVEFGIERFADAMTSENYAFMVVAKPVAMESTSNYFENLSVLLDYVHRVTKTSMQITENEQRNFSIQNGEQSGGSAQTGISGGVNVNISTSPWFLKRWCQGIKKFIFGGKAPSRQEGNQIGAQFTEGTNWGTSNSVSFGGGSSTGTSTSVEIVCHQAVLAEELLKMLQTRLKNGIGEGLWETNVLLFSDSQGTVNKGCNILKGMWSGGQSYQDPLRTLELSMLVNNGERCNIDNALALIGRNLYDFEHPLGIAYAGGYSWLTSGELAIEANLPYYELPALSSEEIVDYGRYLPSYDPERQIELGTLVDRNIQTDTSVWMDTSRLNRHLFVTGITGAGKSNTIRSLLLELARLGIPFLVIEPVKSEYRHLNAELAQRYKEGTSKFECIDVFSLSSSSETEKLVLNPFAFEVHPGEDMASALISHIDRLKAVFNASLGMYSSMPYILEEMIYKAYVNAGWNIETGENKYFEMARHALNLDKDSELRNLFLPRLSDLLSLVDEAIKGFFPKESDYGISLVGALKSRLNSLTRGAKGALLNQRLSIPMQSLLERPCVIELEDFADNDEKAFVMALLLSRIYEFRSGHLANELKHVLIIEEAHRLLSKPPQSGEFSANSRGKSVEVFSDMLAEIRAYGQGIVIADQIPAKLVPDVIKNTDIKIVHRLMAKEDREAVGTAMNLNEKQIADLTRATPGMATVSFDGLYSAIRVKIRNVPLIGSNIPIREGAQHANAMILFRQNIFLKEPLLKTATPAFNSPKGYWLVVRLFVISCICERTRALITLRTRLTRVGPQKTLYHFDVDELWPCVAEGCHALMNDFCNNEVTPGEAGVLISLLASFAYQWSQSGTFEDEKVTSFANYVCSNEFLQLSRDNRICVDFLNLLIQLYADRTDFHAKVEKALLASTPEDWTPLQKILLAYTNDLTCSLIDDNDAIARIIMSLRLLHCFRTQNDELIKKAGLAFGTLRKLLPDADMVVMTQHWEEKQ